MAWKVTERSILHPLEYHSVQLTPSIYQLSTHDQPQPPMIPILPPNIILLSLSTSPAPSTYLQLRYLLSANLALFGHITDSRFHHQTLINVNHLHTKTKSSPESRYPLISNPPFPSQNNPRDYGLHLPHTRPVFQYCKMSRALVHLRHQLHHFQQAAAANSAG